VFREQLYLDWIILDLSLLRFFFNTWFNYDHNCFGQKHTDNCCQSLILSCQGISNQIDEMQNDAFKVGSAVFFRVKKNNKKRSILKYYTLMFSIIETAVTQNFWAFKTFSCLLKIGFDDIFGARTV
jgi:hypothetical protein